MSVTPTATSHQIKNLEERLGITLFVRRTRAVSLTEEGKKLIVALQTGLTTIKDTIDELSQQTSTLTISTTPAFAALWLVQHLPQFQQQHPTINVQFDTSTKRVNLDQDKHFDLVIRYGQTTYENWVRTPVSGERIGAYGTPSVIEMADKGLPIRLIDTHWQQTDLKFIDWPEWLRAGNLTHMLSNDIQHYDQEHHAINAALAGQGLVLTSCLLVEEYVKNQWITQWKPHLELEGLQYNAYCLPEKIRLPKVMSFIKWLKQI